VVTDVRLCWPNIKQLSLAHGLRSAFLTIDLESLENTAFIQVHSSFSTVALHRIALGALLLLWGLDRLIRRRRRPIITVDVEI